ncbi:MAG TPA: TonB-dependent receptor [Thermoanaerobaculia bacterium]|nr:TonB-dependent receptor [Thermoanaerobaculia bacterium]
MTRPQLSGRRALPFVSIAFAWALLFLLPAPAAWAQTPGTGAIRGRIASESGTPVPAAEVTVTNEATGFSRTTASDAKGIYALPELPLTGTYRIRIAHEGFAPQERAALVLRAGQTASIDVVLQAAAVESSITVFGTAEGVQSDSPQLGLRLDNEKIQQTPLLGRKLTSLPLLSSAVRSARGTGDLFLSETLFVVNGGGRRQTTYTVDGGTADDAWGRQTIFTTIPLGAIQELTVLTNSFSAEYGRTTGAALNLVTRSGTNQVHADILGLSRPAGLQSDAPVTKQRSRDKLQQESGFASGPLVRDRAYWSVAAEYNDQNRDSVITSPLAPGVYTGQFKQTLLFGRLDLDLSSRQHLLARFDSDRFSDTNPQDAVGGVALPSAARIFRRSTENAQLGDTAVLGAAAWNDARLVWEKGDPITQFSPVTPSTQYVRPGVSTEGESRYALLTNEQTQLADTLSLAFGNHFLKVGGDVMRSNSGGNGQEFGAPFVLGQFTFKAGISPTTPTSQLTINDVQRYTQGFGNVHYTVGETLSSLFAQDDYRLRSNLVLNLGLRYDRQSLTGDDDNVAPRLGFAWNPGNDPKTTVRGGFGSYYSEIQANTVAAWALNGPTGFFSFTAAPGQLGFPTSLQPLSGFPAGAVLPARDITLQPGRRAFYSQFFDVSKLHGYPDQLLNPRTDQATLGAERQLGNRWFLSADVVHARTEDIPRNLDLNAPAPFDRTAPGQTRSATVADATRPIQPVPNGYRRILVTVNQGEARYDGLQLNLRKDFESHAGLLVSYTWSHARNNVEPDAPGGDPSEVNRLGKEWADSLIDQRHRAVLSGWMRGPWALTLGGVAEIASGRPYNIMTGADNNGDGSTADRPVIDGHVIGRNAGRGANLYDLSLFVEREFPLGLIGGNTSLGLRAEVFNLTNHANVVGFNGVFGNNTSGAPLSTFGQPLGGISNVDPGRQFQVQARLRF